MKLNETVQVQNLSAGAVCVAHVTLAGREAGSINAKRFQAWFDKGGKRLFDAGILELVGAAPAKVIAKQPEKAPVEEPVVAEPVAVEEPVKEAAEQPEVTPEPEVVEGDDEAKKPRSRRR